MRNWGKPGGVENDLSNGQSSWAESSTPRRMSIEEMRSLRAIGARLGVSIASSVIVLVGELSAKAASDCNVQSTYMVERIISITS